MKKIQRRNTCRTWRRRNTAIKPDDGVCPPSCDFFLSEI